MFKILNPLKGKRDLINELIGSYSEKSEEIINYIEEGLADINPRLVTDLIEKLVELRTLVNNLESNSEIGIDDEYDELEIHLENLYVANIEKNDYVTQGRFEKALSEVLEWSNDED